MSELQPIENRRHWKGIIADYEAIIASPVDNTECWYCLTVPQAQLLIMYADTLRWRTRWLNWDGNQQVIEEFADNLIERLMMACCCEQNEQVLTQVSSDGTYQLQVSYDGGETWEMDNSDPRLTTPSLPPLPEGTTDLKCQAAWNMRKGIEDAVALIGGVLDVTLTLFAIAAAIAGVLAIILFNPTEAYRLIPIVIQLAGQIASTSEEDFLAAFSTADYDFLQCAIYCNLNDEGQLSDIQAMLSMLFDDVPETSIEGNAFKLIAWGIGLIGLNAMGSTDRGTIGYDCDSCACTDACPDFAEFDMAYRGTVIYQDAHKVTIESTTVGSDDVIIFTSHPEALLSSTNYSDKCCTLYMKLISGTPNASTLAIACGGNYNANLSAISTPMDGTSITDSAYWYQLSGNLGHFTVEFTDYPNP